MNVACESLEPKHTSLGKICENSKGLGLVEHPNLKICSCQPVMFNSKCLLI